MFVAFRICSLSCSSDLNSERFDYIAILLLATSPLVDVKQSEHCCPCLAATHAEPSGAVTTAAVMAASQPHRVSGESESEFPLALFASHPPQSRASARRISAAQFAPCAFIIHHSSFIQSVLPVRVCACE